MRRRPRGHFAKRPIGVIATELLQVVGPNAGEITRSLQVLSRARKITDSFPASHGTTLTAQDLILFTENSFGLASQGKFGDRAAAHRQGAFWKNPQLKKLMDELVDHLPRIHRDHSKPIIHFDAISSTPLGEMFEQVVRELEILGSLPLHIQASMMSMASYRQAGQQVFVVGPRLQEMFGETSLRQIPSSALRMPYPSIYVALPDCDYRIWGDDSTGWHRLSGFYALDLLPALEMMGISDLPGAVDAWMFFLWGSENERSRGYGDDASFYFTIGKKDLDRSSLDLEQWLRAKLAGKDLTGLDNWEAIKRWKPSEAGRATKKEKDAGQTAASLFTIRVFFNLMLYLGAADPELVDDPRTGKAAQERRRLKERLKKSKNPKKRKQAERALTRLSAAKFHLVAPTIEGEVSASEVARRGRRRHWVRGHWREYRTEKFTWIQPHERAKESVLGAMPRSYELGEDED